MGPFQHYESTSSNRSERLLSSDTAAPVYFQVEAKRKTNAPMDRGNRTIDLCTVGLNQRPSVFNVISSLSVFHHQTRQTNRFR